MAIFAAADLVVPPAPAWDLALSPHIYVFYSAFLLSYLFTPVMRSIAMYYGIIDEPDRIRKLHTSPVAYLGGAAVFLGWLGGLATSQVRLPASEIVSPHLRVTMSIVVGAMVIVSLGLWDDLKKIPPRVKITGQIAAALILLWGGVGTECLAPVFAPIQVRLGNVLGAHSYIPTSIVTATSCLTVVCMVVGCCNATNLLDGLDGLCGGVTAVIAGGFLFLAVNVAIDPSSDPNWAPLRIVLALALLGAVLGFVPYNFNPASIFMGDTGSMFLGFSCATLIILFAQEESKWFLAALVMFALPVLDTALAFVRRWVNRRPLFSADRHHFHHQLVARGFTIRQTVVISYGLAVAFCLLGGLIACVRTRYAVAFYLVIFGSIIVAAYKMGLVHEKPRVVSPKTLSSVDAMMMSPERSESTAVVEMRDAAPALREGGMASSGNRVAPSPPMAK